MPRPAVLACFALWTTVAVSRPAILSPILPLRPVSQAPAPVLLLYRSQTSEYPMTAETVVRDSAAWAAIWTQLHNGLVEPPLPAVDFAAYSVVLVAIGQRSTGGSEVRITDVARAGTDAVVRYTVTEPGAGCMSAQVMTSPVEVVRVPRLPRVTRFERATVRRPC